MTKAEEFLFNCRLEYKTIDGVDVPTFESIAKVMEEYAQFKIPSASDMYDQCRTELEKAGEYPTGGYSVRSPKNYYRTGFQTCWRWIYEHVRKE